MPRPAKTADGQRKPGVREQAVIASRANLLRAATRIFAKHGFAGGRVGQISKAAKSYDRMIYYYFGSKEGLYLAVLEASYRAMRETEADLHLGDLAPEAALRRLVEFTFDHHLASEPYIRLVMAENMQRGHYMAQSQSIEQLNVPAISAIEDLYARGLAAGVFRAGVDAIDLHATISALCFFNVANRHTFGLIFKRDYTEPAVAAARRESIVQTVLRFVQQGKPLE